MIKNKVVRTKAGNSHDGGYSELEKAFNDGWVFKNVVILNDGSEAEYILEKDVDEDEECAVWIPNEFGFGFVCSKCNSHVNSKSNKYCHNCGKYMRNNTYNKYYVEDGLNKEADY